MSTPQVPGYVAANNDHLHDGCWAEKPSRLLFVETVADGEVTYRHIDLTAMTQTHDTLPVTLFNRGYSDAGWTWHDKSPKPAIPDGMADAWQEPAAPAAKTHEHVPS